MSKNYFKIALRNLRKYKGYSVINITGLAAGMACSMLILMWVQHEISYDTYHEKADRIFRLTGSYVLENGSEEKHASSAAMWAPALTAEYPEVLNYVRFYKYRGDIMIQAKEQEKSFYEGNFYWADSTIFDVFTFPLLSGNPQTALARPNAVVISKSAAQKYFGDADPIGEILTYVNQNTVFQLSVTGVLKDVPTNSHMHPEFIASLSTFKPGTWLWIFDLPTSWDNLFYRSYILLKKGSDYKALEARLPAFLEKHVGETATEVRIAMQPLTNIRLHSNLIGEFEVNGRIQYVYVFASIAILILLVACINYMNLTTARSFKRAKEIGMRKTLGGHRKQLIGQLSSVLPVRIPAKESIKCAKQERWQHGTSSLSGKFSLFSNLWRQFF